MLPLTLLASTVDASSSTWPTVDCGSLLRDDLAPRTAALDDLRGAIVTRGFFYCAGVGELFNESYIASIYDFSRRAHALPPAVKRRHSRPHGGYTGPDAGVMGNVHELGKLPSLRAWDYSREPNAFVATQCAGSAGGSGGGDEGGGSGKYPGPELLSPRFEDVVGDLYDRQQTLAAALLEAIGEVLGLPPDAFTRHLADGELGTVRLMRYP
eukprot:CAMPEP_0185512516 /NCGR_PEP_ID=MMETSP1366-20130426/54203_1 /TAXON_ID=38817 /ORGANISM="Gephyrocapsa oceanica, Strain RCC1303" /LENGTH=210 /DNA_ID=CAMNT_0028123157 /DNA_START=66 /DNA_END=694 /DNA_ORIENTATION=-